MRYPDNIDSFESSKRRFRDYLEEFSNDFSLECERLADRDKKSNSPEYTTKMIDDANSLLRRGGTKYYKDKLNIMIPITNFFSVVCGVAAGISGNFIKEPIGLATLVGAIILTFVFMVWNHLLTKGKTR
ncbi:hypothetical protein QM007_06765 [Rothia sp. SD9660Na]|uniref:hypothetical protein n=1 Tax=Rothia sp. SD9660Na TaxID=3047030 RepID=UPI0024BB1DC9|nr:hypothetical protein [Rothia sp. SD9660Na]WHS49630.1 hypothetical protein QM007_06765 [Rothia sp. SD9660Na]